ncbi:MAG: TolB family protein, partial [Rubripirellula sp.]
MKSDGTDLQVFGNGYMPKFSPDGKQIAFNRIGVGVMCMNADGSNQRVLDVKGWGVQWSPDGQQVAFYHDWWSDQPMLVVLDLKTKAKRMLLEGEHAK